MSNSIHLCTLKGIPCVGYCGSKNYKNECGVLQRDKHREERSKSSQLDYTVVKSAPVDARVNWN